jgi:hypothetical protein
MLAGVLAPPGLLRRRPPVPSVQRSWSSGLRSAAPMPALRSGGVQAIRPARERARSGEPGRPGPVSALVVFDSIDQFSTLVTCLRLILVGTMIV